MSQTVWIEVVPKRSTQLYKNFTKTVKHPLRLLRQDGSKCYTILEVREDNSRSRRINIEEQLGIKFCSEDINALKNLFGAGYVKVEEDYVEMYIWGKWKNKKLYFPQDTFGMFIELSNSRVPHYFTSSEVKDLPSRENLPHQDTPLSKLKKLLDYIWGKGYDWVKVYALKAIENPPEIIRSIAESLEIDNGGEVREESLEDLIEVKLKVGKYLIVGTINDQRGGETVNFDNFASTPKSSKVGMLGEYLQSKGYFYPSYLVSQFYTALKTKGFVILSGLTGTGKTKITPELAELLDESGNNFLFLPVRPDWRDSKALLGYYNPLTGEYHKTELLEFILKARKDYKQNRENTKPYFVLLDEMNLAHVEYYFADFLSVLESGRDEEGFTREPLRLHDVDKVREEGIPKEIHLPPNLYFIGTVNMDETTYAFSPKVLDRAFVVEFHDVELGGYPPASSHSEEAEEIKDALRTAILKDLASSEGIFLARSKDEINRAVREFKGEHPDYWKVLTTLNKALEPYDMHFGYRVVDEIALFFKSAKESQEAGIVEFESDDEIFDLALLMKVLPKFHGNRKRLEKPLTKVLEACIRGEFEINFKENTREKSLKMPQDIEKISSGAIIEMLANWESYRRNFRFKHTAKKVLRMLRQLYEIGFASFS